MAFEADEYGKPVITYTPGWEPTATNAARFPATMLAIGIAGDAKGKLVYFGGSTVSTEDPLHAAALAALSGLADAMTAADSIDDTP